VTAEGDVALDASPDRSDGTVEDSSSTDASRSPDADSADASTAESDATTAPEAGDASVNDAGDAAVGERDGGGPGLCGAGCPASTFASTLPSGQSCNLCYSASVAGCGLCQPLGCSLPHAQAGCSAEGTCVVASCNVGWADCDGVPGNGCEADLSSAATCTACSVSCSGSNYLCSPTGCVAACGQGQTFCNGRCVDLTTSPTDCGACGTACTTTATGATTSCNAGHCTEPQCAAGLTSCGGACTDTVHDPHNCGGCGQGCSAPDHGSVVCADSRCVAACPAIDTLCGTSCVETLYDPANCGACGHTCTASQLCNGGTCVDESTLVASMWLTTGLSSATFIGADSTNVYWFDGATYTIDAVSQHGGPVVHLATNQYLFTNVTAMDGTYLYWVAHGILRTKVDGSGAIETLAPLPDAGTVFALAVQGSNLLVAWNAAQVVFESVPLGGGSPTTVTPSWGDIGPGPVWAIDGTTMYFASTIGVLDQMDMLSGSIAGTLGNFSCGSSSFQPTFQGVAVDANNVYTSWGCPQQSGTAIRGFPKSSATTFDVGFIASNGLQYTAWVVGPCEGMWGCLTGLGSANCDEQVGSGIIAATPAGVQLSMTDGHTPLLLPVSIASPTAMAYANGTLFWLDSSGAIGRLEVP
jgi:hypothetical protein